MELDSDGGGSGKRGIEINDRRPMGYISPPFRCTAHQFPRAMIGGHYQSDVWLARLTFRNPPTLSADYQVIFSTHV